MGLSYHTATMMVVQYYLYSLKTKISIEVEIMFLPGNLLIVHLCLIQLRSAMFNSGGVLSLSLLYDPPPSLLAPLQSTQLCSTQLQLTLLFISIYSSLPQPIIIWTFLGNLSSIIWTLLGNFTPRVSPTL